MLRRDSCKVRRFVERGVPLDSKVYVLGKTRIDDDAVAPVVKKRRFEMGLSNCLGNRKRRARERRFGGKGVFGVGGSFGGKFWRGGSRYFMGNRLGRIGNGV